MTMILTTLLSAILSLPTAATTPCQFEDSPGPCYWNAAERGNGVGESFLVLSDGTVLR